MPFPVGAGPCWLSPAEAVERVAVRASTWKKPLRWSVPSLPLIPAGLGQLGLAEWTVTGGQKRQALAVRCTAGAALSRAPASYTVSPLRRRRAMRLVATLAFLRRGVSVLRSRVPSAAARAGDAAATPRPPQRDRRGHARRLMLNRTCGSLRVVDASSYRRLERRTLPEAEVRGAARSRAARHRGQDHQRVAARRPRCRARRARARPRRSGTR